jgi:hypothetical protein
VYDEGKYSSFWFTDSVDKGECGDNHIVPRACSIGGGDKYGETGGDEHCKTCLEAQIGRKRKGKEGDIELKDIASPNGYTIEKE